MSSLWDKKYKPKNINDLVMLDCFKEKFKKIIKQKDIGNPILLYGPPGHGKTLTCELLITNIDADFKIVNASDQTSVDFIRTTIIPFAKTMKRNENKKIILMDEADRLSTNALDLLKKTMVDFADNCSFLFCTNHIERFPEANLSRFNRISLLPTDKESTIELQKLFFKRAIKILKSEEVEFDKKVLQKLIRSNYPDFRQTIIILQEAYNSYGKIDENALDISHGFNTDLIKALKNKASNEDIIKIANDIDGVAFYHEFHDKVSKYVDDESLMEIYQIYSYYNPTHTKAISKTGHLASCLLEIRNSDDIKFK